MTDVRCAASVSGSGYHNSQCLNKGRYEEEGRHWCGRHQPSKIRAKQTAQKEKWDEADRLRKIERAKGQARLDIVTAARAYFRQDGTIEDLEKEVVKLEGLQNAR